MINEPRYIAQGPGGYYPAPGQFITPAPRTYKTAAHAQLANPKGRLYVGVLEEGADRLHIEAQAAVYPVTLQEYRTPGLGAQAEGAVVLRDMGPRADRRWAVGFRNDQTGGCGGNDYFDDFPAALEAFAEDAAKESAKALSRIKFAMAKAAQDAEMAQALQET